MHEMTNINTREFWEDRFQGVDEKARKREEQTRLFAESQITVLDIPGDFDGTILDFGCALGDAMPIYSRAFPRARLIGVDISANAISRCEQKFGNIAKFINGDHHSVPDVDIIISSNVFEHLSDDRDIAKSLLRKCRTLYIVVPYKEQIVPNDEHVNSYDENYFQSIAPSETRVFLSKGWTQYGLKLLYEIHLKNVVKFLIGKERRRRSKQIIFKLVPVSGESHS
jgi:SAM-dependent methyltransferase